MTAAHPAAAVSERPAFDTRQGAAERERSVAWRPVAETLFVRYAVMALALTAAGVAIVHVSFLQGLRDWDVSVSRWFVDHRTPAWDRVCQIGSDVADTLAVVGVALVVVVILLVRHRARDAALVGFGLALEAATFITANNLVRRGRPPVITVGDTPTTFSFPSGHVAATIVLYGALALLIYRAARSGLVRGLIWLVPVGVATWVSVSRIYRGMHFATDVIAGILLGVTALLVTISVLREPPLDREEEYR
jgi:membrane-associated phospholipid phosphatase